MAINAARGAVPGVLDGVGQPPSAENAKNFAGHLNEQEALIRTAQVLPLPATAPFPPPVLHDGALHARGKVPLGVTAEAGTKLANHFLDNLSSNIELMKEIHNGIWRSILPDMFGEVPGQSALSVPDKPAGNQLPPSEPVRFPIPPHTGAPIPEAEPLEAVGGGFGKERFELPTRTGERPQLDPKLVEIPPSPPREESRPNILKYPLFPDLGNSAPDPKVEQILANAAKARERLRLGYAAHYVTNAMQGRKPRKPVIIDRVYLSDRNKLEQLAKAQRVWPGSGEVVWSLSEDGTLIMALRHPKGGSETKSPFIGIDNPPDPGKQTIADGVGYFSYHEGQLGMVYYINQDGLNADEWKSSRYWNPEWKGYYPVPENKMPDVAGKIYRAARGKHGLWVTRNEL